MAAKKYENVDKMMKPDFSQASSNGLVASASKAYRVFLTHHGLADFSSREIHDALATLRSHGPAPVGCRDIRFQAASVRLRSRKDLSPQTVQDILHQLVDSEYDLDQAEWERDCQRQAALSHAKFKMPSVHKS